MSESQTIVSILYLGIFRLSIITVGAISIYLGYKLFIAGIGANQGNEGSGMEASMGGTTFAVKNAAPGTFFALFGVVLISAMLINAPAEVTYQSPGQATPTTDSTQISGESISFRGNGENDVKADDKALASRINNYAWDLFDKGETETALTFALLANRTHPKEGNILDSIAEFLYALGQYEAALQFKQEAILQDASLATDLQKYQQKVQTAP
ncbi:tetratricopeptide repeat protein [Aliiglaciecola lipolytica]|uniref:Uncharacterized protein n=1 Tax=Aliiglaciecola lipolytica E3 TaxID=1127673 RepID=K6YBQ9_9ALTE|nr:hypothetical protein [Aliiglaciecola lipolytica]GAC15632.1 hypothetical protein GLIP_3011 [Aliiglaciecola lipolytica E3]